MDDIFTALFFVNLIGGIIVIGAATARKVNNWIAFFATLFFTPIVGFLFVLCHPTWEEIKTKEHMEALLRILSAKENKE